MVIFLFYKEFMVLSFDPVLAATLRLPSGLLTNLLLIIDGDDSFGCNANGGCGIDGGNACHSSGNSFLVTHRLWQGMLVSAAIGAVSAVTGLYLSYYFNIVSGSAIVLTATFIFLLVFIFQPHRGLLWKKR